jgi:hypothetical protein
MFPESNVLSKKMCGSLGYEKSNRVRWGMREGLLATGGEGFGSMMGSINKILCFLF